jgi:hypothetical protein
MLIAAFEHQRLDRRQAAKILKYNTYRNRIAYLAHRKKRLADEKLNC